MKSKWTTLNDVPVKISRWHEDLVPVVGVVNVTDGNVCALVAICNMPCQATPGVILPYYSPRSICRVEHLVGEIEQLPVWDKLEGQCDRNTMRSQWTSSKTMAWFFPSSFKHFNLITIVPLIQILLVPILPLTWYLIAQDMMGPGHHGNSE